ncbi:hypothetical protein C0J52_22304 [Blattella germanica]|nr:hypothetical protein C0J52_22304 [Blattella germanica]
MQHMVRLLCASTCLTKKMQPGLNPNRKCSFPNCELYQEKVQHMMACEQITKCPVRHCSASRRLLSHWLQCKKMMCLICNPICRLLLIWRAHYDNVFNEGEEDCPDITTITHGVGGISLNIINQPKFNTVLRLMHGISIQENEDLDDVIGVINRMNIRDSMNGSRTSTGGPAVDDFGMGSMLRMLEQISVEEGEFNSMLKLMQTTSLSDAQISSKDDVTANPEEVVDALNKQHDHNAHREKISFLDCEITSQHRGLLLNRESIQVVPYLSVINLESYVCREEKPNLSSVHGRHVPYVILRDTSQHYPQLGVRHQGPNSYADRLLCPLKPSPIGISSNYLNIYIGTEVDELINLIKTPEQAIRAFHALKNIGKPNISFLQHLQQILKKSLLRETKHSAEEGIFQIKFMYEQVVYSRISQQLHTSFTSMSIKPTPPS